MKKGIYIWLLFVCLSITSGLLSKASAQEIIFSDDFSGDLSKWEAIRDDGRYWSIVDQSLQANIPFESTITELIPTASAWKEVRNYIYDFDFKAIEGGDKNISFGVVNRDNWYEIHFTPSLTEIARVQNGMVLWSARYDYILQNNVNHHFSLTFNEGRIFLSINGTEIFQTTDPFFENPQGRIAVKASTGGIYPTIIKIDNVVVTKIGEVEENNDTILGVELIKQTDPQWANLEYDSAKNWAPALQAGITFEEWACNLVSQLMIMKYHGITTFADNTPITPQNLNAWLLANKGFYDSPPSGNINRKSISQLTAEISKKKGTPKLEFLYVEDNLIDTAVNEIAKGNPVILELDGHFVVADGFKADKSDLYIKDPAYNISKLSEHHLPLKSVRLYTPSQTDLSYISAVSHPELDVKITTANAELTPSVSYSEQLRSFSENSDTKQGPVSKVTEIAKPNTGEYILEVTNTSSKKLPFTLTVFTTKGASQELLSQQVGKGITKFKLQYVKDGKSTLAPINDTPANTLTFAQFRKVIKQLTISGQIKEKYFEKVLLQLVKPAEGLSPNNQKKLLKVVKIIVVNTPKRVLTKAAQTLLLDHVSLLMVGIQ